MLQALFHAWERRLASVTKDRVVRPFDWGLDWIPQNGHRAAADPAQVIGDWVTRVMSGTDAFFTPEPTTDYTLTAAPDGDVLTFPSALTTPDEANNTVYCRYFPASAPLKRRPTNANGRYVPASAPLKRRPTNANRAAADIGSSGGDRSPDVRHGRDLPDVGHGRDFQNVGHGFSRADHSPDLPDAGH